MIRSALLLAAVAFAIARAPYQFVFPRDHASHPEYRTEWWYYTGHLRADDGRTFGYELTFFRVGMRPGDPPPRAGQSRWRGNELFAAHFAISSRADKRFVYTERFSREALNQGGASQTRLAVRVGDWSLRGRPFARNAALERMMLHAVSGKNAIDLAQTPEKPPAIHGQGGVSVKAACRSCASHYYSYTRLRTEGRLTYEGKRLRVVGTSWMDHEFGSSELAPDQVGWDWFSIQLDDRREIMLYVLRQKDGSLTPQSSGSVVERNGSVRRLSLGDFRAQSSAEWKSPHTNARYPSAWSIAVPRENIRLLVRPELDDQELVGSSGASSYWEGSVDVRDQTHPQKSIGEGYVELTGYAQPLNL